MTLDPLKGDAWRGLTDLLRPPSGYRLDAAFLTTFGLSFEALMAALLAFEDVEDSAEAPDIVRRTIAATRLSKQVRVLVEAGTVTAPGSLPPSLAALLEPVIVPAHHRNGVFHPKLWVISYVAAKQVRSAASTDRVIRVVVSSRNLTQSSSLELGVCIEGTPSSNGRPDAFAKSLVEVLGRCDSLARGSLAPVVASLQGALRSCSFEGAVAEAESIRLLWQEDQASAVASTIPARCRDVVAITPFLVDTVVEQLLTMTDAPRSRLTIISNPSELARLSAITLAKTDERRVLQEAPVLVAMREGVADGGLDEEPTGHEAEAARLDGVHAKALFIEDANGETVTIVGSANGTSRGWGLGTTANVECMLAIEPGIAPNTFRAQFVDEKKGLPKGWLEPFRSDQRLDVTDAERKEREAELLAKRLAGLDYSMRYDHGAALLTLWLDARSTADIANEVGLAQCLPLALLGGDDPVAVEELWQPIADLLEGALVFPAVRLGNVSPFVRIRVARPDGGFISRVAHASLDLGADLREARDAAARQELLASADPADILDKLIAGLGFTNRGGSRVPDVWALGYRPLVSRGGRAPRTSLEQLLRAVVAHPFLLKEMQLLLPDALDEDFTRFAKDFSVAMGRES